MKKEGKKNIEEVLVEKIVGGMQCPKDFQCTKIGFERLCKAEDIGEESCLECLEKNPLDCPFVIDLRYAKLCRCPLRIYIAKNLEK
ncbi:hypothetical protein ACFLZ5_11165 [Thermodesulfobacteriota bacterium]